MKENTVLKNKDRVAIIAAGCVCIASLALSKGTIIYQDKQIKKLQNSRQDTVYVEKFSLPAASINCSIASNLLVCQGAGVSKLPNLTDKTARMLCDIRDNQLFCDPIRFNKFLSCNEKL